jgi:dTMP kinase
MPVRCAHGGIVVRERARAGRRAADGTAMRARASGYGGAVSEGTLITIEGIDGAGKSTLAGALAHELGSRSGRPVEVLREPGGVELSERIRALVKDPRLTVGARAEALLYAAARAQLVEERVVPLLQDGAIVLLDRFVDSSLAYQGAGRGLGVDAVRAINELATGGLAPQRTLLLRIDPAAGRARLAGRGGERDRLELERAEFFTEIARCYEALARSEPQRIAVIDASQAPERVLADALAALADAHLGGPADD